MYNMCNLLKHMCLFKHTNVLKDNFKHLMCNFKTPNVSQSKTCQCILYLQCSKHIILEVVYDRFLFHANIASKLATDKPTGIHAAR